MTFDRMGTRGLAMVVVAAAAGAAGGCGTTSSGPGPFERRQAETRPADPPPPTPSETSTSWSYTKNVDTNATAIECVPACVDHAGDTPDNTIFTEKIRGQVVVARGTARDVLPFVVVNVLRDGKVVGTTKADVAGRFTFAKLPRGPAQLALDSSTHDAKVDISIGFATTEVVLIARPR